MPRIEQSPDGTYGKRMTETEKRTLAIIYKEQNDRGAADVVLQNQIVEMGSQILSLSNDLSSTKNKLAQAVLQQATDKDAITLLQTQYQDLLVRLQAKGSI